MPQEDLAPRLLEAVENIATELERLRMLREHELEAEIKYDQGDPYVEGPDEGHSAKSETRHSRFIGVGFLIGPTPPFLSFVRPVRRPGRSVR